MASIINAATSGGLVTTADTSGILQLQTAGTTAVTVDASQNVSTTNGVTIQGLTVGLGAGAVSTNTVLGTSAYRLNTTGSASVVVGNQAGYTNSTGIQNVFIGHQAGYAATGRDSTFVGTGAGGAITSGTNNTIIGQYDGNGDGLDIRTASNYAVISDGDGNRLLSTANGQTLALDGGAVPNSGTGITFPATQSASSNANTLDDYEEGTWTPSYSNTNNISGTPTLSNATYTKTGNRVIWQFQISGLSITSSATQTYFISGYPFTQASALSSGVIHSSGYGVTGSMQAYNTTSGYFVWPALASPPSGSAGILYAFGQSETT